jgi:GNAT superfamily N-acetyltransferase
MGSGKVTAKKITIRRIEEGDLPAVGNILVDTWRSTFSGLLPAHYLNHMSPEHQSERVRRVMVQPSCACLVAVNSKQEIVGYASGGENRGSEIAANFELYAIYVRREHQGSGIGRQLFNAVAKLLIRQSAGSLFVWVLTISPFLPFYERLGGRRDGIGKIDLGGTSFDMIAYLWDEDYLFAG